MKSYQEWVAHYSALIMRTPPQVRQNGINILCHVRDTCKCNIRRAALHNVLNTVGAGSK
jgi:hypothetical protein